TGSSDGLAILRRLAADQVFTSLVDASTSTFRTHRLFREFLLARLDERPREHRRELHRRAMRWAMRDGDLDQIVWHGVEADEHATAMEAVSDHLLAASNRGQIDDMWRWIRWIGTERVLADRSLAALPAWVSLNQRRYDEIEPWLEAIVMVDDLADEQRRAFDVHASAIRAGRDRHLGRLDDAVRHAALGVELAAATDDDMIVPTVMATHAQLLALTGDDAAEATARTAIDAAIAVGQEPPLVMAYAALGLASDDPDAAAAAADSALSFVISPDLERFHRPALAWLVRARAALDCGRVGDAADAAGRAVEIAALGDEPAVTALALACRARVHHLLGDEGERRADLRAADAAAAALIGADWIADEVRAAHAATRFAPGLDADRLPVGARELSERELAVLRLLPFGLPRRELAAQLFVSENTVKTHLLSIRRKLGVAGRDDVVARARELGLLHDELDASRGETRRDG
ncbi:MAG: LuxR C-terminal-related transcriptional regulator, partial [Actinomycetota bacterium]